MEAEACFYWCRSKLVISSLASLAAVGLVVLAAQGSAADPSCRQSWMPSDAPAFCSWSKEQSLPQPSTYHAVATFKNSIYVLGGYRYDAATQTVIYYNRVFRSNIGIDGHLSAWATEPSFANPRAGAAATEAGNCIYVAGGSSSSPTSLTYYDDVQYARVGIDGSLSPWTTS